MVLSSILASLPALQVVLPLLGAFLCMLIPAKKIAWPLTFSVSVLTSIITSILLYKIGKERVISYAFGGWHAPIGIEYKIDSLNAFMLVLVSYSATLVLLYAQGAMKKEIPDSYLAKFYSVFLLCLGGLLGILVTNDAFNAYVFLEIASLASYALIAIGKDRRALLASFEYLVLGTIGASFILIAVGLLYMMLGTLNMSDIASKIEPVLHTSAVQAALIFFIIGILLKIAIFPLHVWLINSYTYAPSAVSAFLAGTGTKVGLYLLIKIMFMVFTYHYSFVARGLENYVLVLASLGIVIASTMALFQDNIKRMLAYSGIAQLGFMLLGIAIGNVVGFSATMIQMVSHTLAKIGLFMIAGCVLHYAGGMNLKYYFGIGRRMPVLSGCFIILGASIIGIPFTVGFISKWYLLQGLWQDQQWLIVGVVVISTLLAIGYLGRVIEVMYFKPYEGKESVHDIPKAIILTVVSIAVITVGFGCYPKALIKISNYTAKSLFEVEKDGH